MTTSLFSRVKNNLTESTKCWSKNKRLAMGSCNVRLEFYRPSMGRVCSSSLPDLFSKSPRWR